MEPAEKATVIALVRASPLPHKQVLAQLELPKSTYYDWCRRGGGRLLVLGTYRDVELRRAHPLSQALGELGREGLTHRITLRGLTAQDVARFIEITSGVKPPGPLVEAVYRETEGNPFFVNEVVRLLVADGRLEHSESVTSWSVTIPQGVREVVGRRLDPATAVGYSRTGLL